MSDPTERPSRHWLLENGAADWLRWAIAMSIGAAVTYGSMTMRIEHLEREQARQDSAVAGALADLRDDVRELRSVLYQPRTVIESAPGREVPRFPRDERFGANP